MGFERIGGIMVFNITDVYHPQYIEYINPRDFTQVPGLNSGGDLGPEGMLYIDMQDSPNGKDLLVVSNEISGTVAIYQTDWLCGNDKISVCYNGSPLCIKADQLDNYLQNGAVIGDCGPPRLAAKAEGFEEVFSWNARFDDYEKKIIVNWNIYVEESVTITVYDLTGKIYYNGKMDDSGSVSISAVNLSAGLYFVGLKGNTIHSTQKLVVK